MHLLTEIKTAGLWEARRKNQRILLHMTEYHYSIKLLLCFALFHDRVWFVISLSEGSYSAANMSSSKITLDSGWTIISIALSISFRLQEFSLFSLFSICIFSSMTVFILHSLPTNIDNLFILRVRHEILTLGLNFGLPLDITFFCGVDSLHNNGIIVSSGEWELPGVNLAVVVRDMRGYIFGVTSLCVFPMTMNTQCVYE